ncbi:hypothetical protein [Candidatus Protochlamydia phocaeensis]|uniref:hypothetical protein n=1 Tax=Candidatus Protochlamydia phocaeensis TaxID=1414722 RepID=UPI0008387BE9|nr:hypothetical protein [Candidatus Protochlamydia phocaeensis]
MSFLLTGIDSTVCTLTSHSQIGVQSLPPTSVSLADMVESIVRNPLAIPPIMQLVLDQPQSPDALAQFFLNLRQYPADGSVIQACQRACAKEIEDLPIFHEFFEQHPLEWRHLLMALDEEGVENFLNKAILRNPRWKECLAQVIEKMKENKLQQELPLYPDLAEDCTLLLEFLSEKQRKTFIKFCATHLSTDCLALVLYNLNNAEINLALNRFIRQNPLTRGDFEGGMQKLINAISHHFPFDEGMHYLLDKILQKYYLNKRYDTIICKFLSLSPQARLYLLASMSIEKQRDIYRRYRNDLTHMVEWMSGLLLMDVDLKRKQAIFNAIYSCIRENKIYEFWQALDDKQAPAIPFLFICAKKTDIQDFAWYEGHSAAALRTRLFSHYMWNGSTRELMDKVLADSEGKGLLYDNMLVDLSTAFVPAELMSVKVSYDHFNSLAQAEEIEAVYCETIAKLPPFLLGIACQDPVHQAVFLKLARYLTDEQLRFLVLSIPNNQVFAVIEPLTHKLRSGQLRVILGACSKEQLDDYADHKVLLFKQAYDTFLDRLSTLLLNLQSIQYNASTQPESYEHYYQEATNLLGFSRQSLSLSMRELVNFIESQGKDCTLSEETLATLNQTFKNFDSKKGLLEGSRSLVFCALETLKSFLKEAGKLEEDYDPFATIYEGFWNCLKNQEVECLDIGPESKIGVPNIGELQLIGIKTDKDLAHLSIAKERQAFLDQQCAKFKPLFENLLHRHLEQAESLVGTEMQEKHTDAMEEEDPIEKTRRRLIQQWEDQWHQLFTLRTSSDKVPLCIDKLIEFLEIPEQNPSHIVLICQSLIKDLLSLDNLTAIQRKNLETLGLNLSQCRSPIEACSMCNGIIKHALKIIRRRHTLVCLQFYCRQGEALKQAWEQFRLEGFYTIDSLISYKRVSRNNLINIQKLFTSTNH